LGKWGISVEVVSINVGKPSIIKVSNKELHTGIVKSPVSSDLHLSYTQLEGDGQADLVFHGGLDKVLCVYCLEHYPYWERTLGHPLEFGAFGENLTVSGLLEADICIGDIFSLGEAIVQVSQPRQPCYKLAQRHEFMDLAVQVQNTGFTGYYLRVIKEGLLPLHAQIQLMAKHPAAVHIEYANQIKYHDKHNVDGIKRILVVEELSASWRGAFLKRLAELEG
jgi:MOSC domain-containing protein YiiM